MLRLSLKKTFLLLTLLFFVSSTVFSATKGKNVGIVNTLSGTVNNFHKGETLPEVMEVGSKVYLHDKIVTTKGAKAQIIFRDDSAVTLGPETELTVDTDSYNKSTQQRESVFTLAKGRVRSVVGKNYSSKGSRFEIHTPTAVAGVRGTVNIIEAMSNKTTVYSVQNNTFVHNINPIIQGELVLPPKKGAYVLPNRPPQPFDYEYEDPVFKEFLDFTTTPDGKDAENDINSGALGASGNQDESGKQGTPPAGQGGSEDNLQQEQQESKDTPPYDEETPTSDNPDASKDDLDDNTNLYHGTD